jgi:tRNA A37 threonylcarbamoyladenosine dehydratase
VSYNDRFSGLARLYGQEALDKFKTARVAVVGIGGVGSWVAEALARSGFENLWLIDMDDICVTNTNRQIHALTNSVGNLKVETMAERLRLINPDIQVTAVMDFITMGNITEHLQDMEFVVDAIDSVKIKAAIVAWCNRRKTPMVMIGAAGGQVDPTRITVGDLNKTYNDPLARKVRSIMRREYGFSRNEKRNYGIPCVYSTEQLNYPQPDGSVCQQKQFVDGTVKLDCSGGIGASTMVTASFGMVAAAQVAQRMAKQAGKEAKKEADNKVSDT